MTDPIISEADAQFISDVVNAVRGIPRAELESGRCLNRSHMLEELARHYADLLRELFTELPEATAEALVARGMDPGVADQVILFCQGREII